MSEAMKRLVKETGIPESQWTEVEGPDSGHAVDRWFVHVPTGQLAYVNDDQGDISITFPYDQHIE